MKKVLFLSLILSCVLSISAQEVKPVEPAKPMIINGGVVNGKATLLAKPVYPAAAKAVRASGAVSVQVVIDEEGNVVSASATSGHPLLRAAAEQAARASKFSPTILSGQTVKVTGVIVYNFVADGSWISVGQALVVKDLERLKNPFLFPKDFADERSRLDEIIEENKPEKLEAFTQTLQSKLFTNKSATWELSIGLTLGKIKTSLDDQNEVRTQLFKIKELSDFPVENTSETRLAKLKELAAFIEKTEFDKNDKILIANLCNSIY